LQAAADGAACCLLLNMLQMHGQLALTAAHLMQGCRGQQQEEEEQRHERQAPAFAMDANSGKFMPAGSGAGGSLQLQLGGHDEEEQDQVDLMAHAPPALRATQTSQADAGAIGVELPRAPSPKYDERTSFFFDPLAFAAPDTGQTHEQQQQRQQQQRLHQAGPSSLADPAATGQLQQRQLSGASPTPTPQAHAATGPAAPGTDPPPSRFRGSLATPAAGARAPADLSLVTPAGVQGGSRASAGGAGAAAGGGAGPTPSSQAGIRFKRSVPGKGEQLTVLSLEVHAESRGALLPDPRSGPLAQA
jgi:hypothetical protein